MKDFYSISEPYIKDRNEYRKCKRETVLNTIKPICDAFGIKDYDYILNDNKERLVIEGTQIGCACNSIGATVRELITYLFVVYSSDRLCALKTQTLNQLKAYWITDNTRLSTILQFIAEPSREERSCLHSKPDEKPRLTFLLRHVAIVSLC